MLWINHPKPAGSGQALAALAQRDSDKPAIAGHDSAPAAVPELHTADIAPAAPAPLDFKVRYTLPEYVSFMWQHAGYLIRRRRIGRLATWYMLVKSTWGAAYHFVTQGRSRHTYDFTIDRHGIVRTMASGVTLIGWEDVSAIRTYARGYLMVLKRGTLPIPYRCLSSEQSGAMMGYCAWLKAGAPGEQ